MPGATLWKGSIHFGGTDVAVKLRSAVREERIQFHLLHAKDRVRLRQQMVCVLDKQPVPSDEQIKGFEVEEGKYLLVEPDELEQTLPEAARTIEVREFVRSAQVDPLFIERTYSLEPDMAVLQGRGYDALVRALAETGRSGICTWTMRKRSYFGALQAHGTMLRLSVLRLSDEVVPAAALGLQTTAVSEKELAIGSELIEKLTAAFDPKKFENGHVRKLRELIEKKARGEQLAVREPRRLQPTAPDDLLQVLEESLKKAA